jgi:uncharacterized protein with NRDE domain
MCLIAFAIGARTDLPLVIASNRDEHWSRPTQPLQAWTLPSGKQAYSGRDLQAGGSWLGLAQDGRVALLTNVRNGQPDAAPRSRGELVTQWLDAGSDWQDWLPRFDPLQYGGFNLVLGDLAHGRWAWVSNRSGAGGRQLRQGWAGRELGPGVYGLSNAELDTPWPKTVALRQALRRHVESGAGENGTGELLAALLDKEQASAADLPCTGVDPELERQLSSAFVHAPAMGYGTRSSLIVHAGSDGSASLKEWTHAPDDPLAATAGSRHWPLQGSRLRQMAIMSRPGWRA